MVKYSYRLAPVYSSIDIYAEIQPKSQFVVNLAIENPTSIFSNNHYKHTYAFMNYTPEQFERAVFLHQYGIDKPGSFNKKEYEKQLIKLVQDLIATVPHDEVLNTFLPVQNPNKIALDLASEIVFYVMFDLRMPDPGITVDFIGLCAVHVFDDPETESLYLISR